MNIVLLISLFVCHYIADYSHLSTKTMLSAKRVGKPLSPIFAHAAVHTALMAIPIELYNPSNAVLLSVLLLQLFSHWGIDILKGKCNVWFPSVAAPANNSHWYIFGFDQLLHQIVIVAMWYLATNN